MRRDASTHAGAYGHGDLGASLVLIFPLLPAYELGVMISSRVNGADFISRLIYLLAGGRTGFLLVHLAIAIGFMVWIRGANRWATLRLEVAAPVVLEAAIYALTLGTVVSLIVDRVLGLGWGSAAAVTTVDALGAGVHEELVFRLGAMAALVALVTRAGLGRRLAVPFALIGSALLFAAAHHLGAYGEPWAMRTFVFRTVAGIAFGAMFWYRSLAHAVYAHVLYDLVVALQ